MHDHHTHPLFYSAFGKGVQLESVTEKSVAIERIVEVYKQKNPEMLVANGWRSNWFSWRPNELERLPPVAIFNVSLHSLVMNSSGREVLRSRYGDSIEQVDDRDWYESNLRTVLNWFANLNASDEGLKEFYANLLTQHGIYSAEELLLVDEQEMSRFDQVGLGDRVSFWSAPDVYQTLSVGAKSKVAGLKLFTDGAIGSRTAAMQQPYLDDSGNHGMLVYTDQEFRSTIDECLSLSDALAVHAIGDRAIEQVIATLEAIPCSDLSSKLIRIEHAQMITRAQARRAKELGVVLSMQPNFSCDSADYRDRLSVEACHANNPFRMLIDEIGFVPGDDLIFGSDGMPHGVDHGLNSSLFPPVEGQRLTLEEFVQGYCLNDRSRGSIIATIDQDSSKVKIESIDISD